MNLPASNNVFDPKIILPIAKEEIFYFYKTTKFPDIKTYRSNNFIETISKFTSKSLIFFSLLGHLLNGIYQPTFHQF